MVFGGMKKKKRQQKGQTDRIAAALILQRFLDSPASRT
jgi:RNase H-fold protein (predicted Holliday junction resolvase)